MNKQKYLWVGIVAILTLQLVNSGYDYFGDKNEIVYIDNAKLLKDYLGMVDARKSFEEKSSVWRANIDTLSNEIAISIRQYETEMGDLSKKEKQLSQELIRNKQVQLQKYQQVIQQQSAQEDERITQEVLTKVNVFIAAYGEANNYKIIMGANTSGNIIYAQSGLDITDEVIRELNNNYQGS